VSLQEILVVVHIVAAAAWIGGGMLFGALAARAWSSRDEARVLELSEMGDYVGRRVFGPAAAVLLIAGVWAVIDGSWSFSDTWVSIGFAAWIIGVLIAAFWHRTEGARIRAAVAGGGVDGAAAQRVGRLGGMIGAAEILVLIIAVWAMVAKPGL
jgi:uncharacterized membrane protein